MTLQTDTHGLMELTRDECLALLGSVPVGRVVCTSHALPAVRIVNFLLLPDGVYLRTTGDGTIARTAHGGGVVAFEADDVDVAGRYGWSVVVLGRATVVASPELRTRVVEAGLQPWAAGVRDEVVRIELELVTGRRAGGAVRTVPAG